MAIDIGYQPYPWHYPNATLISVPITCDPDALQRSVADGYTVDRSGRATAWIFSCDSIAGVGRYSEFLVHVPATSRGEQVFTTPYIYVNNDAAVASGREVLGVPKKYAAIDFSSHGDQIVATVSRSGITFVDLSITLDEELPSDKYAGIGEGLSAASSNPSIDGSRLITGGMTSEVNRAVRGRAAINTRPSAADPLYLAEPKASKSMYIRGDFTLQKTTSVPLNEGE
ncbi:hypothetical protein FK529_15145 [Tsukamurella asaccharolytica]|uniref:Acetoacetate decarboxylase n=1 Tax=Tsukamurella asaccharolytica TaxID=2592067 RepID=A0A5C5R8Q0_9ACTN|nr:acetoacetate decarboxylase family protein [Tsukamurella asaccharolytica]TWS18435.1 hypothetical protein FK529_15145 [Tsukamurella asaccharolytica]